MNMLGRAYFILPKGAWVGGDDSSKAPGFVVLTYFARAFSEPEGGYKVPPPIDLEKY